MAFQLPFVVVPLPLLTVTTGNERTSRPAIHLNEFKSPGMVWQSTGNANLWVRGTFSTAKPVDFVSVLAANALPGTTIRVRLGDTQAAVDGTASYDSGVLPFISPSITRDDGLYSSHLEFTAQTRLWWRIDIAGHTGDFAASMLVMGQKQQSASYYSPDFEFGFSDSGSTDFGRYGIVDDTDGILYRTLTMNFGWLSEADRTAKFQPLAKQLGARGIALWCFDPDPTAQRQEKTYFGKLQQPLAFTPSTQIQTKWQAQFDILSMF